MAVRYGAADRLARSVVSGRILGSRRVGPSRCVREAVALPDVGHRVDSARTPLRGASTPSITEQGILVRTYSPKPADITRAWRIVDADGLVLGRLATEVASVLRGKHKPIFAPNIDIGDHVIVINADKVVLTSGKAEPRWPTATAAIRAASPPPATAT